MKLTAFQQYHLRLLVQLGVNRHIPPPTAAVLKRHALIEWTGTGGSVAGQEPRVGGWVLTDAGIAAVKNADGVSGTDSELKRGKPL